MLPNSVELVSVDDHVIEHRDVWQSRLPAALRERGPRIVENEDGRELWAYEDKLFPQAGLGAVAGRDFEAFTREPIRYDEMLPGCFDPKARLLDMDADGVAAEMCFPTFPRFCGQTFAEADDKDLALLCLRAYNDFILEEWYGLAPTRYIPLMIVPLWDPQLAVEEVERTAALGGRAVAFSECPTALGLPSFHSGHWDPLFAALQEADMPMCMHIGSGSRLITSSDDAPDLVAKGIIGCNSMIAASDLLFSHVFHDFPGLRVALSEGGGGWVPYLLERCDRSWDRYKYEQKVNLEVPPSQLFQDHIWVCIIDDRVAVENRHVIGVDKLMWESDYPHADTTWPNSRAALSEMCAGVPVEEVALIAGANARKFFNFPG